MKPADASAPPPISTIAILRVQGIDQKGIVAAFAQLLYGHGANILSSEQHTTDPVNEEGGVGMFYQRTKFDISSIHTDKTSIITGIKEVCNRFSMTYDLSWGSAKKKVAIFVSKYDQ